MDPAIEAFETLAAERVTLGDRHQWPITSWFTQSTSAGECSPGDRGADRARTQRVTHVVGATEARSLVRVGVGQRGQWHERVVFEPAAMPVVILVQLRGQLIARCRWERLVSIQDALRTRQVIAHTNRYPLCVLPAVVCGVTPNSTASARALWTANVIILSTKPRRLRAGRPYPSRISRSWRPRLARSGSRAVPQRRHRAVARSARPPGLVPIPHRRGRELEIDQRDRPATAGNDVPRPGIAMPNDRLRPRQIPPDHGFQQAPGGGTNVEAAPRNSRSSPPPRRQHPRSTHRAAGWPPECS